MIEVDTNIPAYAHREDSPLHKVAFDRLVDLAEGRAPWTIPWPCIHEFLAVVTHPRIYAPPTPLERAVDQVEGWLESPSLVILSETEGYWRHLRSLLEIGRITGPQVHDCRVAALCRLHGVTELWTADRDFSRVADLRVSNPLVC